MAHEKEYLNKDKYLELQYATLRKEIETRQDRHFKLAAGALLIVPVVQLLTAGTEDGAVAEIAFPLLIASPLIVLSLYVLYFSEHYSIMRCGRYIKEQIEAPIESAIPKITGWETWLEKTPDISRTHEKQQIIGFHFLYIPLYIAAAIAAALAVKQSVGETAGGTAAFWLIISVYGIVGVLAVLYVWMVYKREKEKLMPTERVNIEYR